MLKNYFEFAERKINENKDIYFENIFVTPSYAKDLLKRNINNRKLSALNVSNIKKHIINGTWKVTGDTIKFDIDGNLLDGQSRLSAIVEAGIGINLTICRNVPKSSFDVIDTGKTRGASDILSILKIKNPNETASGLRIYIAMKNRTANGDVNLNLFGRSILEIEDLAKRNKNYQYWTHLSTLERFKKILPSGLIIGLGMIFEEKNAVDARNFFEKLATGEGLKSKDPILTLRDRLIANKSSLAKLKPYTLAFFIVKAWNATRQGRKLSFMKISENEIFPEIS